MSKTIFTILRQCEHCGNMFESQKRTTRFCAHRCAARNYKLRKRLESKKQVETDTLQRIKPKVNVLNLELIKKKEYLTVPEVALLFSCSKKTIYRMIESIKTRFLRQLLKVLNFKKLFMPKSLHQEQWAMQVELLFIFFRMKQMR